VTIPSATISIREPGDIAGALGASIDGGGLLLDESQLGAEFFDLDSGFAGEVLQKFTHYRARLAVVVADPSAYGGGFRELVYEQRNHPAVRFFGSEQLARRWLAYNQVVKC
jgi:hypothetical protein